MLAVLLVLVRLGDDDRMPFRREELRSEGKQEIVKFSGKSHSFSCRAGLRGSCCCRLLCRRYSAESSFVRIQFRFRYSFRGVYLGDDRVVKDSAVDILFDFVIFRRFLWV